MADQVACPSCNQPVDIGHATMGMSTTVCPSCQTKFGLIITASGARAQLLPGAKGAQLNARGATAAQRARNRVLEPPAVTTRLPARSRVANSGASRGAVSTLPPATPAVPGRDGGTLPPAPSTGIGFSRPLSPAARSSDTIAPATLPPGSLAGATLPPGPGGLSRPAVPPGATALPSAARSAIASVPPPTPPPAPEAELSGVLGGYEIVQKLGQGGMGAVYLARQLSLDRRVALKVLAPQLAGNPDFVSRFTREAYAAAQLSHHNVVHIHDIGIERGTNFFSMEFVEGANLAQMIRKTGKLDPEAAVGYVLQAARGLRFAHNHGLVHRDIKPDNLLLNEEGIVKVADLGLVKVAGADDKAPSPTGATGESAIAASAASSKTQFNTSMGTPEYMPPEQATDAANVDHRADIYSLGCTLYDLLTGKPPFTGRTVMEILTQHANGQVVPPDRVARHVSPALSSVVLKMTARNPKDRYQTMDEVIAALEGYLGVDSGKPFSPNQQHVAVLESAVNAFNQSQWTRTRAVVVRGFFALCLVAALISAVPGVGSLLVSAGIVGFAVMSFVFYQSLSGIMRRTYLFGKVRELVFGSSILDWLIYTVATFAVLAVLIVFDLHLVLLGFALASAAVAAGFYFTIDQFVARQREVPLRQAEAMFKDMRLRGLDENALRQFVCKYAGTHWEEVYEELFGYEAKLIARKAWGVGDRGKDRPRHGAWRDSVIGWIDQKMRARKEAKEKKLLAKVEADAIAASGVDPKTACQQAKSAAQNMVSAASVLRETALQQSAMTVMPAGASRPYKLDWNSSTVLGQRARSRAAFSPVDLVLGRGTRFALAMVLLLAVRMWWKSGESAAPAAPDQPSAPVTSVEQAAGKLRSNSLSQDWQQLSNLINARDPSRKLRVPFVPDTICDALGSFNGGLAAALLLLSLFFSGRGRAVAALLGVAVALFGRLAAGRFAPTLPPAFTQPLTFGVAGLAITLVGVLFIRGK